MLRCSCCGEEKTTDYFYKKSDRPRGYQSFCKNCAGNVVKKHREDNRDRYKELERKRYAQNPERRIQSVLKSQDKNRETFNSYRRSYNKLNRAKVTSWDKAKRLRRENRVPVWLTDKHKKEIQDYYWLAQDLKKVTGEDYHVDHIVPLNGKNISGLHVPWNLQVLPSDINMRKSNSFGGLPQ